MVSQPHHTDVPVMHDAMSLGVACAGCAWDTAGAWCGPASSTRAEGPHGMAVSRVMLVPVVDAIRGRIALAAAYAHVRVQM